MNSTLNNWLFATKKLKIECCIIYYFFKMKYLKFELISGSGLRTRLDFFNMHINNYRDDVIMVT